MGRRIRWLGLVLTLCFGLVIVQLVNIEFRQAPTLAHSATNPVNEVPSYDNQRGDIFAADGTLLAQSVRIAPSGAKTYQFQRQYARGALFSQIVGLCSTFPAIGCDSGIEGYYDQQLGLHKQAAQTLSQLLSPPPPTTDSVTLTVNPTLQQDAATALAGRDGAVVMEVPQTGALLTMYSNPTFDPGLLASSNAKTATGAEFIDSQPDSLGYEPILPMASYYRIQPGSTAKVVTTAAIYNLDPSLATYNFPVTGCLTNIPDTNQSICNDADTATGANACGGTIQQMLPQSCDPGYAKLGLLLGGNTLAQQASLFGFNQRPPLDIGPDNAIQGHAVQPSEYPTAQQLSPSGNPGVPGQAYSAFGQQDVLTTALQNAMIAAAVANHGAEMAPHFLDKITNAQGQVVLRYQPYIWKQAMSAQAAGQIVPLMEAVATAPGATAVGVFPASLDVAVKTGTAQIEIGNTIEWVDDWMIGFAPANDPKVAIAVVVPHQALNTAGATVAGPIVRTMLEAALG